MKNKFIIGFVLVAILFFGILMTSYAHNDKVIYETVIEQYNQETKGVALAIAKSQHNFDWSTEKLQGSIGMGSFEGKDAISFGIGKRVGQILLNGSVGVESGNHGYGAGITWRF